MIDKNIKREGQYWAKGFVVWPTVLLLIIKDRTSISDTGKPFHFSIGRMGNSKCARIVSSCDLKVKKYVEKEAAPRSNTAASSFRSFIFHKVLDKLGVIESWVQNGKKIFNPSF